VSGKVLVCEANRLSIVYPITTLGDILFGSLVEQYVVHFFDKQFTTNTIRLASANGAEQGARAKCTQTQSCAKLSICNHVEHAAGVYAPSTVAASRGTHDCIVIVEFTRVV
jgi:putative hemolysin